MAWKRIEMFEKIFRLPFKMAKNKKSLRPAKWRKWAKMVETGNWWITIAAAAQFKVVNISFLLVVSELNFFLMSSEFRVTEYRPIFWFLHSKIPPWWNDCLNIPWVWSISLSFPAFLNVHFVTNIKEDWFFEDFLSSWRSFGSNVNQNYNLLNHPEVKMA